jgi:drug/metabolite transporter (DMT)-like permease
MLLGLIYTLLAVIFYSFYTIGLKSVKDRMVVFFWVNIFAYLGYLGIYAFRQAFIDHRPHPIEALLYDFTLTNIPFYILMACFWVGSLVVLDYLLDNYDVSIAIPVTEVSILFSTIGYILLGQSFSFISLLSITIVFIGAIISAFDKLSLSDPLAPLRRFPKALIFAGILESSLSAGSKMVTFICTHTTSVTEEILGWMNNAFQHIYKLPFSFHNPFYYNVGVRFFIAVVFLIYILGIKKMSTKIFTILHQQWKHIAGLAILFLGSVTTYHSAFFLLEDKTVLTALSKLSIPLILIIGHILLKEKVTQPKLVGCAIILLGGLISFLN